MIPYFKLPTATKHIFFKSPGEKGYKYNFSTEINKIGSEWDVSIQNGTYIDILGDLTDPIIIDSPVHGNLSLILIRAYVSDDFNTIIKTFYVPVDCIIEA
jgi:hypothetical protein